MTSGELPRRSEIYEMGQRIDEFYEKAGLKSLRMAAMITKMERMPYFDSKNPKSKKTVTEESIKKARAERTISVVSKLGALGVALTLIITPSAAKDLKEQASDMQMPEISLDMSDYLRGVQGMGR